MKTFPTGRSLSAFFLAGALAAPALFLPAVPLDTRVTVTAWIYTENPV